jgi:hypothetical protein
MMNLVSGLMMNLAKEVTCAHDIKFVISNYFWIYDIIRCRWKPFSPKIQRQKKMEEQTTLNKKSSYTMLGEQQLKIVMSSYSQLGDIVEITV